MIHSQRESIKIIQALDPSKGFFVIWHRRFCKVWIKLDDQIINKDLTFFFDFWRLMKENGGK
jgi:hypothetical protein